MFERFRPFACAVGAAAILAACSGGGGVSTIPQFPSATPAANGHTFSVGPYTGQFTEYALPDDQAGPAGITVGPDGAVWFTVANGGIDRIAGAGVITPYLSPQIGPVFAGIASLDGALWFAAGQNIVRQPTSGSASLADALPGGTFNVQQIVAGPDGNLWATFENDAVSGVLSYGNAGHLRFEVDLPFNYSVLGLASANGGIYVSAFGDLAQPDSAVFKLSTAGKILQQFNLPAGSNPNGIVAGPDGALWIALTGSNSIGRLTLGGTFTQFPLTPGAAPFQITKGSDGALWFTEQGTNAIGRITTAGALTEYPVPTANAKVWGITTCPQQCENAHGRLWFTELNASKVAKFEF